MSLYEASAPVYAQLLSGALASLEKAIAYCAAKKIDEAALLNDRLYPDMRPFTFQAQSFCDHATGSLQRCAGLSPTPPPRDETSLEGLRARVEAALAVAQGADKAAIDAMADKVIAFPMGKRELSMKASDYMHRFAMPNFYFHVTTAYDILRHRGVELGKRDFLGPVPGL